MRYTVETVLENVRVNGVSSESFDQVKSCVNTSLALISESDSVFSVLDSLNSHSNWIYAHSLGVGTYSVMTAKKMGWKSPATSFKLFTAGLLHDIGKKEISTEILNKPRHLLSQEERKYIETHPIRGKEILSEIKEIPGDIIQIVYEHHEDCLGNGYPRQIKKQYIHPLAKVVSVANHFCKHALKTPHSKGLDFAGTLNTLESEYRGRLDYSALKALSFCGTV